MYEAVIGLEVHVHLKTKTKAFCGCSTEFGQEPNSQVCPVCLGFPGCLPVLNKVALDYAIKVALSLNCKVQEYTKFDRKNYFYPDLPKNYQISQYDLPISRDGFLNIDLEDKTKRIGIRRVHLEEDAGKLIHQEDSSLVDFNRAGIPLLEVVSEPDINSPQEAYEYLTTLKSIIEYLDVSDCDMEKGSLRCDANISMRKKGTQGLGVKTELKNMNSFKAVKEALSFEVKRQTELLNKGEPIIQDTRLWDARELETVSMRTKEEAQDYRYFPEPDLTPFIINKDKIEEIKKTIPELPQGKMPRFIKDYGLSKYDAKILVFSRKDADYAEDCIKLYPDKDKKPVVNWLIGPLLSEANNRNCDLVDLKVPTKDLVELVNFVKNQQISYLTAKSVLTEMIDTKKSSKEIIHEKNLIQISDSGSLDNIVEEAIKENAKSIADYKQGKANALMFLVGQVMRKTSGRANPKVVQEILKRRLNEATT
ncbi:MAG: Asp-tRNA(Asn)/Glu-tRNA(Gln) amidotransferase GatCAB subunit B [Candidatus Omnitrophica bacterium CG23_combo_of_CG06-09_8_20_14_all_40_11]|nr:MAG: Asp-tRNA(Asn)/Glu-tRNA(Gln) amidotransferase GatCAB subunit B [Candidatus Omnitrophica bacterium CG23_combo_of_CG06-09_8_20_14_all_40_11]